MQGSSVSQIFANVLDVLAHIFTNCIKHPSNYVSKYILSSNYDGEQQLVNQHFPISFQAFFVTNIYSR